jgi:hypothetical protein
MTGLLSVRARDVLFAHWPVDPSQLRPHVPDPLSIATFEGSRLAAAVARRIWGLPFHAARSRVDHRDDRTILRSERRDGSARFDARYERRRASGIKQRTGRELVLAIHGAANGAVIRDGACSSSSSERHSQGTARLSPRYRGVSHTPHTRTVVRHRHTGPGPNVSASCVCSRGAAV